MVVIGIKGTGIAVLALALAGLAGCETMTGTRGNLSNAAQNLEYNASALARDTGDEMRRREVRAAFARVSRSYHAVRDEVTHSDSLQARRDFEPVTDSYRAIEHELGIYPGRDEYLPPA